MKRTLLFLLFSVFVPSCGAVAEVYLSKDQALDLILGHETEHSYDPKTIDESLAQELEEQSLRGQDSKQAHFFVAKKDGKVTGYALIDEEVGKHLPITYIVGISPAGQVTRVEMMVFREVRGWEARERAFLGQFDGKSEGADLKIGGAVRHVSGATLSSKAIAKGVGRALFLWNHFYRP